MNGFKMTEPDGCACNHAFSKDKRRGGDKLNPSNAEAHFCPKHKDAKQPCYVGIH